MQRLIDAAKQSRLGLSLFMGVSGTLLAACISALLPPVATAINYLPYGMWQRLAGAPPIHPAIVLITRDAETDGRFRTGPIDHAVYARTVTALARAGARVIGLDARLDRSTAGTRGGAVGDAMLIEATRTAGQVVYPLSVRAFGDAAVEASARIAHPSWPVVSPALAPRLIALSPAAPPLPALIQHALTLGHNYLPPDPDGSIRRVWLFGRIADRAAPAFGMALAAAYWDAPAEHLVLRPTQVLVRGARLSESVTDDVRIPTDRHIRMLVGRSAHLPRPSFPSHSLLDVWNAIDRGDTETLREWVAEKVVVILTDEHAPSDGTTADRAGETMAYVATLNTLLTGSWTEEAGTMGSMLASVALAAFAAWLLLSVPEWAAFAGISLLGTAYIALSFVALQTEAFVLPVFVPLAATALTSAGATLPLHIAAGRRIESLQQQIARVEAQLTAVRDDLISRESAVERLEEDLEAAKAAVARSIGKEHELQRSVETVRAELAEARAQEERSRAMLHALEGELAGLRVATRKADTSKAEPPDTFREECERLGIITRDPAVLNVYRDVKKAARSVIPILILGEPGTGKELFARAVHVLSPRAAGPFVAVNMAAVAPDLFESELFGHAKGSFTGALNERKGLFEQAHRGTLFLDEIGDLRPDQQGKLLRVLQEQSLYRVGESQPRAVDVRIVAATNKNLEAGVEEGWFREDLYFRLNGVVVTLPPLRDRPGDVPFLAERFVKNAARQLGRSDIGLSEEAMHALQSAPWPGNVRELRQCLERAVALAEQRLITKADLRLTVSPPLRSSGLTSADGTGDQEVLACLRRHRFDMQATARSLGWDRSTVTQRLKGLGFRALVEAGGDMRRAAAMLADDPALAATVELKLRDYYAHLTKILQAYPSSQDAVAACRKRFKNLPDRHFEAVARLITRHFTAASPSTPLPPRR